jgi:hypothetical protein
MTKGISILGILLGRAFGEHSSQTSLNLTQVVPIRAGSLCVKYNQRRSFNAGSRELGDRVIVVSVKQHCSVSTLQAGVAVDVSASSTFANPDFDDTGFDLAKEVCDQVCGPQITFISASTLMTASSHLCALSCQQAPGRRAYNQRTHRCNH